MYFYFRKSCFAAWGRLMDDFCFSGVDRKSQALVGLSKEVQASQELLRRVSMDDAWMTYYEIDDGCLRHFHQVE